MNDSVHLRNAKALDQRQKMNTAETDALRQRVGHLESRITMLESELNTLRQQLSYVLMARGNGPTARS